MPSARARDDDELPPGMVAFLRDGNLDAIPPTTGFGSGVWPAFALWGDVLHAGRHPEVWDRLAALWEQHYEQILDATPAGVEPWVVTVLAERRTK